MDQRYHRSRVRRYVVIVDQAGDVVAREEQTEGTFRQYASGELPQDVRDAIIDARGADTRTMLNDNVVMHVVPFKGTAGRLRAVVFEEVRVRAANQ